MRLQRVLFAAIGLGFSALALSQTVPLPGTYVSADSKFTLNIASANPATGQIQGTYGAGYSPIGEFFIQGEVAHYSWVNNAQGQSGAAPFVIHFGGTNRPDGWPYAVVDEWNGAYQVGDSILAEGSRALVDSSGAVLVGSLGTQLFKLRR